MNRREFEVFVCNYIGIDPSMTRKVVLEIEVGKPLMATVTGYVHNEEGKHIMACHHKSGGQTWKNEPDEDGNSHIVRDDPPEGHECGPAMREYQVETPSSLSES